MRCARPSAVRTRRTSTTIAELLSHAAGMVLIT